MRRPPFPSLLLVGSLLGCSSAPALSGVTGDTVVSARADGSFDVVVGGRTLLSGAAGPVTLRQFSPQAPSLWGMFAYDAGTVTTATPSHASGVSADGADLVLALDGDGAAATLRFTRAADEVTIAVHASSPALAAGGLGLRFACTPEARFMGFGEQYQKVEHRGEVIPLWTSEQGIGRDPAHPGPLTGNPWTTYFPVPFFLDPRGFGFAVETNAHTSFDLCAADPDAWTVTLDDGGDALLHLYTGPTPADVMRAFTVLQGRSSDPPRWAVDGAWIAVQGGPDRVRKQVAAAKGAGVPVAAVWVQDWIGSMDLGGGRSDLIYRWNADPKQYPDLAGLIAELHGEGIRFLGYFNPFITKDLDQWADATSKGYAIEQADGSTYTSIITVATGSQLDVTNPDAVGWFQGFAKGALALGQDGWMCDFGEWLPFDAKLHAGDAPHEHNLYPTRWHQANRDVLDADKVIFTRSGWLGEGKTAQVVWAGDQQADWDPWDGLPTVVPAMVNLGLAGIAWVTHDVAGFSGGPSTKELYLRWTELGAFTPILRTHEGLAASINWNFDSDAETLAAFARWSRVHQALAPTFVQLADEHARTGMPIVRALGLTWPDDPTAVGTADEYTIGADLLVAPVLTEGAAARSVYFPAGHWIDVWDPATSVDGPGVRMVDAPIGRPPVFSQSGRKDLAAIR